MSGWCQAVIHAHLRLVLHAAQEEAQLWRAVLEVRDAVNLALEQARSAKLLGAFMEASVLLHVANTDVAARLAQLEGARNGTDELRYSLIVSEVQLVQVSLEQWQVMAVLWWC
jgi:isoleucyl-tRNA synthetase